MNEGNYPDRPSVTHQTELDSSNSSWVLSEPLHNFGTRTDEQMSLVKDYEEPQLVIDKRDDVEMVDVASEVENAWSRMILESIRQEGNMWFC